MVAALGSRHDTSCIFACRGPQCCTVVFTFVHTLAGGSTHLSSDSANYNTALYTARDRLLSLLAYVNDSDGCSEIFIPA